MGLRSWFTRLDDSGDWDFFRKSLKINPVAYGVAYVLDVTEPGHALSAGVWVAWSGDGSASLYKFMPAMFVEPSVLLDNLPEFHPPDIGRLLKARDVEPRLEERWRNRPMPEDPKEFLAWLRDL